MSVLRWLFNLVTIAGYFAAALILGSWLMVAAPAVLSGVLIAAVVLWERLGES